MNSRNMSPGLVRGNGQAPMLVVDDLHVNYGAIAALKGVTLKVYPGEIVTLIGVNGAGKSTTMRTISGLLKPKKGTINFEGTEIGGMLGNKVARMGIAQSPEGRRIFPRMTVAENLELGAFMRDDDISSDLDRVFELFPRLKERVTQKAGTLSGGEQQMVAMARALMSRPRLLLLDEPSMGLAPLLVETVFNTIVEVNKQGTTVLLVEQNALVALNIGSYGYVLETGKINLEGEAKGLATNDEVRKAYLGED
jgi:branched-chain amino acid transport system ATP-binding protein